MVASRGFSLTDLVACTTIGVLGGAILIAAAPQPHGPPPATFNNLRLIAQAASAYQADNNHYFPYVMAYRRGVGPSRPGNQAQGWCGWSFGGKNNNAFWSADVFDIEAADRPLNPYVIPDEYFYAPLPPLSLPANHPARTQAQAPMFHDPGDTTTHQRSWPNATPGVSAYDDVGTSYETNMAWWDQVPITNFENRFNEGARRIAVGQGASPSRFVWLTDEFGNALSYSPNPNFRITNGYGDLNAAPMLFLDGHTLYDHIAPTVLTTKRYTFRFEP